MKRVGESLSRFASVGALCASSIVLASQQGATVYFSGPSGFVAYGTPEHLTLISKDRFQRVLARFRQGDLFDELQVSRKNDMYAGVFLTNKKREFGLEISFLRLKHRDRITAFRDGMKRLGYRPIDENAWNVGQGKDLESLTLKYRLREPAKLFDTVQHALTLCDGSASDKFFVQLYSSKDGPAPSGIRVVLKRDFLGQIR